MTFHHLSPPVGDTRDFRGAPGFGDGGDMEEPLYTEFKRTKMEEWERRRSANPAVERPTQDQILREWLEIMETLTNIEVLPDLE